VLIPIRSLKDKYHIQFDGVLHVGAHLGEEGPAYADVGVKNVWWIEGDSDTSAKLKSIAVGFGNENVVITDVVSDLAGQVLTFNIASNGQSSSILEFGLHSHYHPEITYNNKKIVVSNTIDSICAEFNVKADFLNLDLQGAELLALQGAKEYLAQCNYVYTEVNDREVYRNCALIGEVDSYLADFGFERVETEMTHAHWGDAFYIRRRMA